MNGRLWIRISILLLLIILSVSVFVHYDLYSFLTNKQRVILFVQSYGSLSVFIFIIIQIIQVIAAPIPGEISGIIGGYLYGPFWGTLYSTIGLTMGSWLAFVLARFLGFPLVERIVKPDVIQKYNYFMEKRGAFISFLLFLLPGVPKDYLCYIIGLSHIGTGMFLLISTIGRLFGTILLSVTGSYVRNNQFSMLFIILGIGGLFLLLAYFYRDHWLAKVKRKS
jgi:uncharacterized membrane protein YdjX (TVP38/TMEM64 family)